MTSKRLRLPKRFNVATTEEAYGRLRALHQTYWLSNNYLLTVLLEHLDEYADREKLDTVFRTFIAEYGAPAPVPGAPPGKGMGSGMKKRS
jgi:hypothetical protein